MISTQDLTRTAKGVVRDVATRAGVLDYRPLVWSDQRWEESYADVSITVDGLVPVDEEHVLALVSISATQTRAATNLRWAAAHLWTLREGRIAGWETHLDLAAARRTLDA